MASRLLISIKYMGAAPGIIGAPLSSDVPGLGSWPLALNGVVRDHGPGGANFNLTRTEFTALRDALALPMH